MADKTTVTRPNGTLQRSPRQRPEPAGWPSFAALERACGLPLSIYREAHLEQRIGEAMRLAGVDSGAELARALGTDPALRARLRARVANSTTAPFRDREQFELLERELLPPLLGQGGGPRVWSAGCSDGSELLSLAEILDRSGAAESSYLLGSDILPENLAKARAAAARRPAALARRLRWELRDLSADGPPPGLWDLVLCRNVAIYLTREARERVHATLVAALAPAGVLMLGRSERLLDPARHGLREVAPHAYRRIS